MNRLALAVRSASEDALSQVSLESLAESTQNEHVSMEQEHLHLEDLMTLADGLEGTVASLESLDEPTLAQHRLARKQALTCLKMSGLSDREVEEIFPSLEADNPNSGWERFKAFIMRLWNFIVESAKKIYKFVDNILKSSSLAEKAAMVQLRNLRAELSQKVNGLTIEPKIPFRPAHRYLLACQHPADSSANDNTLDLNSITRNIQTFQHNRDTFQNKMPQVVEDVIQDLIKALNELALGGTAEQIATSIVANGEAIKKAVVPMFPNGLKSTLGFSEYTVPLIYDRVLTINDPLPDKDIADLSETEIKDLISQLGLSVVQVEPQIDPSKLGTFPALRIADIEKLLKLASTLIDEGHSADQQRKWKRLQSLSKSLGWDVDGVLKAVLKQDDLTSEARTILTLALNARQAMGKWISAPFMQINTVNIRVVESLLALANDQLKNYELRDSAQERSTRPSADKPKQDGKKEAKADRGDGDHEFRG